MKMQGRSKQNVCRQNEKGREYLHRHVLAETHMLINLCMCTCARVWKNTRKTREENFDNWVTGVGGRKKIKPQ